LNWRRRPPQDELEFLWATDDGLPKRDTGRWALHKLAIMNNYFREFNRAAQKAPARNYVDGFAGHGMNHIRGSDTLVHGSAILAKRSSPHFTNLLLMDQNESACDSLRARVHPDPRIHTLQGDCNAALAIEMARHLDRFAPTLCVLDPNGVELHWRTVEDVSAFRTGPRKTELLITFARNMALLRLLNISGNIDQANASLIDSFFGTREWASIYEQRVSGSLEPAEASERYLQLYETRLADPEVLGYKHVHSTLVRKRGDTGGPLYFLLFASDDDAGSRIMQHVFDRMTPLNPQLQLL
jgi:three-Cys-motif partner protein